MFFAASQRAHLHRPVSSRVVWEKGDRVVGLLHPNNRWGAQAEVEAYCLPVGEPFLQRRSPWGPDVFSRIIIASAIALALQWGTTGAAIIVVWFTPTTGEPFDTWSPY